RRRIGAGKLDPLAPELAAAGPAHHRSLVRLPFGRDAHGPEPTAPTTAHSANRAVSRFYGLDSGRSPVQTEPGRPNEWIMSLTGRLLRRTAIALSTVVLVAGPAALIALGGLGMWIIAVLGGAALGAVATLTAVAISGASRGTPAP